MIVDLKNANKVNYVGNKAKGLYDLIQLGLKVPKGFVISFDTSILDIKKFVEKYVSNNGIYVVRSSSNMEDSSNYSFAGLFDTFVGINKKKLVEEIEKVRNMKGNKRVVEFCSKFNIPIEKIKVSVVVQRIVDSQISGICFTKNPITNNKNEIFIEAILGQGEYVVSGEVNPDTYIFNKKNKKVKSVKSATQHKMLVLKKDIVVEEPVFNYTQKMSNHLIEKLSINALKIEKKYRKEMDIEFAIINKNIYYLQARPITT